MRQQYLNLVRKVLNTEIIFLFPGKIIKDENNLSKNIKENLLKGKRALICDKYIKTILTKKIDINLFEEQIIFGGECCPEEFRRVYLIVKEKKIKNLIAAGGGKVLDLAKYIKKEIPNIHLINIPTSASTCAAFTPVSVLYNKDGSYFNILDTLPPDVLIIDYIFFKELPEVFFAAGIMDTLAKFYEIEIFYKNEKNRNFYDNYIRDIAYILKQNIFKIIKKKRSCLKDDDRIFLTDCNIIYSGLVSCIGIKTITSSIAHALAHAITAIPQARKYLHGEHITVSLLIQEELLENKKNIADIKNVVDKIDMPDRLSKIGVSGEELNILFKNYNEIKQKEKIYIPIKDDLMYNIIERNL